MTARRISVLRVIAATLALAVSAAGAFASPVDKNKCTFKGLKLYGKVQFVKSFPDFKVQIVKSFPDLKVQTVGSFPDACGKWQVVTSFPDFKVQIVESFPDLKIEVRTELSRRSLVGFAKVADQIAASFQA